MNDIEQQEQAPSESEAPKSAATAATPDSRPGPSKTALIIALLALLLAVISLIVSNQRLGNLNADRQQDKALLTELQDGLGKSKLQQDKTDKAIAEQQAAFKEQEEKVTLQTEEMQQSLDLIYERIGRSSTQWLVAEAEYLMRIANHRLQLEGDSATALVALERADKRLHDSGDPAWTQVREKLAAEMTELRSLKELDLTGQAAKLSGLISQIDKLKLPHAAPAPNRQPQQTEEEAKKFNLDTILQDSWEGFKSLVVVRRNDRSITAVLKPEQRFFLYQNLRLQLEASRLALLRRNQSLFDASLERAEAWIREFFDQEQALTKGMLEEIGKLRELQLAAKLPDISGSLHLLLEQQGRAESEPARSEVETKQPEAKQAVQEPERAEEEQPKVNEEQKPSDTEPQQDSDQQPQPDAENQQRDEAEKVIL